MNVPETFTPEEAARLLTALASAKKKIDEWIGNNATRENSRFDGSKLIDLVRFAGTFCRDEIEVCSSLFARHDKFATLPFIRLYGCPGDEDDVPDLWLIGWRDDCKGVEFTRIHDHNDSRAVILVIKGRVVNQIFRVNPDHWRDSRVMPFRLEQQVLVEGASEFIQAPAIHRVADFPNGSMAITVNGYYPPLDSMAIYEAVEGALVLRERWQEEREDECD